MEGDTSGTTPLLVAAKAGDITSVLDLLQSEADPNEVRV
jgi:ankyrin repeat protein